MDNQFSFRSTVLWYVHAAPNREITFINPLALTHPIGAANALAHVCHPVSSLASNMHTLFTSEILAGFTPFGRSNRPDT